MLNEYRDSLYQFAGGFVFNYKQAIGIDLSFW